MKRITDYNKDVNDGDIIQVDDGTESFVYLITSKTVYTKHIRYTTLIIWPDGCDGGFNVDDKESLLNNDNLFIITQDELNIIRL